MQRFKKKMTNTLDTGRPIAGLVRDSGTYQASDHRFQNGNLSMRFTNCCAYAHSEPPHNLARPEFAPRRKRGRVREKTPFRADIEVSATQIAGRQLEQRGRRTELGRAGDSGVEFVMERIDRKWPRCCREAGQVRLPPFVRLA
jgi:hypothetical protein